MKPLSDKGVAGLDILFGVIVMLFVIGFLIMIFAITGGELQDNAYDDISGTNTYEVTDTVVNETGVTFDIGEEIRESCTFTACVNSTSNTTIASGNWTETASTCSLVFSSTDSTDAGNFNNTLWNCTYTYTAERNSTASGIAEDTYQELGETTDWFGIIIVISAMVVLILLTVIIISAIRGSGMVSLGRKSSGSA